MKNTIEVQGYGLGEFCKAVQDAVDQGYRFDLDSNENYPSSFGAFMRCIMVKVDALTPSEVTKEANAFELTEEVILSEEPVQPSRSRGRK